MLYDPKWEVETKPDVYSLEGLIAWLEKQPAERAYSYTNPHNCLLCQYFAASGVPRPSIAYNWLWPNNDRRLEITFPMVLHAIALGGDTKSEWAFGKALTRAREALASRA